MEYIGYLRNVEEEWERERKKCREREKESTNEHKGHEDKKHTQVKDQKRVLMISQQNSPNFAPHCCMYAPVLNFAVRKSKLGEMK